MHPAIASKSLALAAFAIAAMTFTPGLADPPASPPPSGDVASTNDTPPAPDPTPSEKTDPTPPHPTPSAAPPPGGPPSPGLGAPGAEPARSDPPPGAGPGPAAGDFVRPILLHDVAPRYPEAARRAQREADVAVLLTIDENGAVTSAEPVPPLAGDGLDEEAVRAALALRFTPARVAGRATPVRVRYTFRFRLAEKDTVARAPEVACPDGCPGDTRRKAVLTVRVHERGTRHHLPRVQIYFLDQDEVYLTDEHGVLRLELAPGGYAISIRKSGFYPFESVERLESGEQVIVDYRLRRDRNERYRTLVWGAPDRAEVSRTALVEEEMREIPGTMNDPLRVISLLPGVTTSISGGGYPIVRGALPGDTLYEIEGLQVPMLYHMFLGRSVLHPYFIDQISFEPGGYSAEHGRFVGARIAADAASTGQGASYAAGASIIDADLFARDEIAAGTEAVAAVRYGTLGALIEAFNADLVFRFWDYQGRLSREIGRRGRFTVTAVGAYDTVGEIEQGMENVLRMGFHRLDLRYRQAFRGGYAQAGTQLGLEGFSPDTEPDPDPGPNPGPDPDPMPPDGDDAAARGSSRLVRPYVKAKVELGPWLTLLGGGDLHYERVDRKEITSGHLSDTRDATILGAWAGANFNFGDLFVAPSVRVDHYRWNLARVNLRDTAADPRLNVSYRLTDRVELEASGGIHHGPSRLSIVAPPLVFGPVPTTNLLTAAAGLSRSYQVQGGLEVELPAKFQGRATLFYHDTDVALDSTLLEVDTLVDSHTPCLPVVEPPSPPDPTHVKNRAAGAELILRRRLGERVFGWAAYTLSRTQRTIANYGTVPGIFDRRHVFDGSVSWQIGRNWTLGGNFHFNTGRPYTPEVATMCPQPYGWDLVRGDYLSARLPSFWRVDLRVQKREVFDTWYFDFYIDVFNALARQEVIDRVTNPWNNPYGDHVVDTKFPLLVPMLGIRGVF